MAPQHIFFALGTGKIRHKDEQDNVSRILPVHLPAPDDVVVTGATVLVRDKISSSSPCILSILSAQNFII